MTGSVRLHKLSKVTPLIRADLELEPKYFDTQVTHLVLISLQPSILGNIRANEMKGIILINFDFF